LATLNDTLAVHTGEPVRTLARIASYPIETGPLILAGRRTAVVDVHVAQRSGVAREALALEALIEIDAG
jgi:hypothetical protein